MPTYAKPSAKFFAKRNADAERRADDYARALRNAGGNTDAFVHAHLHVEPYPIGRPHEHTDTYGLSYRHSHDESLAHCGTGNSVVHANTTVH